MGSEDGIDGETVIKSAAKAHKFLQRNYCCSGVDFGGARMALMAIRAVMVLFGEDRHNAAVERCKVLAGDGDFGEDGR